MENISYIALILATIVLLKYVFKLDLKKAKPLKENKDLEALTNRFPENIQVAKEMLEMLGNSKVKIEEAKNTETSLYIAVTDKILIADMKNNYARIQTIAHECLHSVQDRRLLLFNFIFSNIVIVYWIAISILTFTGIVKNVANQMFILLLLTTIKFIVRGFLEIDAMTKSKYLAKEYIESKNILTKNEEKSILEKYEEINKLGVPFTIVSILTSSLVGTLIYGIISII